MRAGVVTGAPALPRAIAGCASLCVIQTIHFESSLAALSHFLQRLPLCHSGNSAGTRVILPAGKAVVPHSVAEKRIRPSVSFLTCHHQAGEVSSRRRLSAFRLLPVEPIRVTSYLHPAVVLAAGQLPVVPSVFALRALGALISVTLGREPLASGLILHAAISLFFHITSFLPS